MNKKNALRKVLFALIAIALLVPLFAAFEAHTVNVKAHIENALAVTPKQLDFGTVFPEEQQRQAFRVCLSRSFQAQDRVVAVDYRLAQELKPKDESVSKLDVVFAFDCTYSMASTLEDLQDNAEMIVDQLGLAAPDVQFGVVHFMDYYPLYTPTASDVAYARDQAVTSNVTDVKNAIAGLPIGNGGDFPQCYTRVMYEAYSDNALGWRPDAKHVVIMFGDDVPHDDNVNQGVPGKVGTFDTGIDPGRNGVIDGYPPAGDDLDLQTVLDEMATRDITLYMIQPLTNWHPGQDTYLGYWKYWTGLTGGDAVRPSETDGILGAIEELLFFPDLRPYITKVKDPTEVDTEPPADSKFEYGDLGRTFNNERDVCDGWSVNLLAPCIEGAVGRDWHGPVLAKDDVTYGANIWVEVTRLIED